MSNIKFKKEIEAQKDIIIKRVKEMENDDFYNVIDKEYIDDLFTGFQNSQEIENIITETVNKMESLKEGHEVSAYVGLKLQEMIEQQEKLGNEINNNSQILINLKKNIKNNIEVMRKNIVKRNEDRALSSSTSASGDENPISKFISLKSKNKKK